DHGKRSRRGSAPSRAGSAAEGRQRRGWRLQIPRCGVYPALVAPTELGRLLKRGQTPTYRAYYKEEGGSSQGSRWTSYVRGRRGSMIGITFVDASYLPPRCGSLLRTPFSMRTAASTSISP